VLGDRPLLILGFSGNGLAILEAAVESRAAGRAHWTGFAFLDDDKTKSSDELHGTPVIGQLGEVDKFPHAAVILAIGSIETIGLRSAIVERLDLPTDRFATVTHPHASVAHSAVVNAGTAILAGARIESLARIGHHVIVLQNAVINHGSEIGNFSLIGAGATIAGQVTIATAVFVGQNAAIRPGIAIGAGAIVGMAAAVLHPVDMGATVVGNPARPLRD